MNGPETAELLGMVKGAYGIEVTVELADVWRNTFHNDKIERIKPAVLKWIEEEDRVPTPAGIRQKSREIAARAEQTGAPELAAPDHSVPIPEGIEIAYNAYCGEVSRQGREPKTFEQFRQGLPSSLRWKTSTQQGRGPGR